MNRTNKQTINCLSYQARKKVDAQNKFLSCQLAKSFWHCRSLVEIHNNCRYLGITRRSLQDKQEIEWSKQTYLRGHKCVVRFSNGFVFLNVSRCWVQSKLLELKLPFWSTNYIKFSCIQVRPFLLIIKVRRDYRRRQIMIVSIREGSLTSERHKRMSINHERRY